MKDDLDFKKIGNKIQQFRLKTGMTQEELGEIIGTTQKYVSRIEMGNHKPYFSTIVAIAKALDIPVDSLVADYDDSTDASNLYLILEEIRGMSKKQLDMLRDSIRIIKKNMI